MRTNTSKIYDTIVIGAGIAGCTAAYALQQAGQDILLLDRSAAPASGGSGAAGAFVSPKIGKGSPLQTLTNEAFVYAKDFYLEHFPAYFTQSGVIRMPKDSEDAKKFPEYAQFNISKYEAIDTQQLTCYGIKETEESFLFPEAGVCDAQGMCRAIWERVCFRQLEVEGLIWSTGHEAFTIQGVGTPERLYARHIVLATGFQNDLLDMRYMGVRGTWGSRGDYTSALDLQVSMHKRISISKNINGVIKLGATHNKAKEPCLVCDGRPLAALEAEAKEMVDSSDFRLKETFCGMRAGSKDYFPLVGKVINVAWMLTHHPAILKGAKPLLRHIENLYILNGVGGRGFVFAPLMAKWLAELIVEGKEMDGRVDPDRLFLKWCRKL